ncbi:superfamily II DNA or RNA helicase [Skermanella aerolata]|uniref:DEAD/DEAH box helicase n=1 Tax=Skermanella aerolata TaxID=393310 RepID=UPI003D234F26
MSTANHTARASSPAVAPVPFAEEDLSRVFDQKTLQRGRSLVLLGEVRLGPAEDRIRATVSDLGRTHEVTVSPVHRAQRVALDRTCTCARPACAHMAAAALLALDTRPQWRRPVQTSMIDLLKTKPGEVMKSAAPKPAAAPVQTRAIPKAFWTIEPGQGDVALFVTATLDTGNGVEMPATPREIIEKVAGIEQAGTDRTVARLLGSGGMIRTAVPKGKADGVDKMLRCLLATERLRWYTGAVLSGVVTTGEPKRTVRAFRDPRTNKLLPTGLPEGGALIKGLGYWCVDPGAGQIFPVELQIVMAPKSAGAVPIPQKPVITTRKAMKKAAPRMVAADPPPRMPKSEAAVIIERSPVVTARLSRVTSPGEGLIDILRLSFDYGEKDRPAEIEPDDQRQFAKIEEGDGPPLFARRDKVAEQAAMVRLAQIGFAQLRIEPPKGTLNDRGTRVHRMAGKDVDGAWRSFFTTHVPDLEKEGWKIDIGSDFGTRMIEPTGDVGVVVRDAGEGWFDMDIGVEVDGLRRPLLPILARLIDRGGMAATKVIDGKAQIVLDDGSVLALPAERVERLFSVLEAMLDSGRRLDEKIQVPLAEADLLIDIDDLVSRRPDETKQIESFLRKLRDDDVLPEVQPPVSFQGELRDYQRTGLAWLQSLAANDVAGILADDMGLGKTAQTLAHIALEHEQGRMTDPCLVVVPTSLVHNWTSEAKRFVPHLRTLVLHGLDRHEKRNEVDSAQIVVTTYGVVARDIDLMRDFMWHLVVLDEAQAIKNPDSRATRAVCGLSARHRLCLSGTPVENNLGELWAQFAFLMPGLLGDRKDFQKRFRTPIEKRGDATRASHLVRRTRPFLLRRTKAEVAKELPPKTEVIRHIDLGQEQRDLYETIRLSVHEKVRAAIADSGLSRNAITVIDALLKLRQVCCDPRLVKIAAAAAVAESAKLDGLIEMVSEMVPEGRRILIFSQFTSMLELIKPELKKAGIPFVELTGSTRDRTEPVERFQRGEVPVFLISLKAGGRGLNLTAADTVIHYDPWWNPAAENQATDRAHRIGQDKPVFVYKLIAANTVEERILELQLRKGNLAAATIEGTGLFGALGTTDIDYLFGQVEE